MRPLAPHPPPLTDPSSRRSQVVPHTRSPTTANPPHRASPNPRSDDEGEADEAGSGGSATPAGAPARAAATLRCRFPAEAESPLRRGARRRGGGGSDRDSDPDGRHGGGGRGRARAGAGTALPPRRRLAQTPFTQRLPPSLSEDEADEVGGGGGASQRPTASATATAATAGPAEASQTRGRKQTSRRPWRYGAQRPRRRRSGGRSTRGAPRGWRHRPCTAQMAAAAGRRTAETTRRRGPGGSWLPRRRRGGRGKCSRLGRWARRTGVGVGVCKVGGAEGGWRSGMGRERGTQVASPAGQRAPRAPTPVNIREGPFHMDARAAANGAATAGRGGSGGGRRAAPPPGGWPPTESRDVASSREGGTRRRHVGEATRAISTRPSSYENVRYPEAHRVDAAVPSSSPMLLAVACRSRAPSSLLHAAVVGRGTGGRERHPNRGCRSLGHR